MPTKFGGRAMTKLSAVVITKNEERNLARCLESVKFADEIVVIDSHSTDRTVEIARSYGASVYSPKWRGYGKAKQAGVDKATGEWILSIDADEEAPSDLAAEIEKATALSNGKCGYYIKRKTRFLGRWIMHCGWYPDYVLRLFDKSQCRFDEAIVHEKVIANGEVGYLSGELLHYSYPDLETYLTKFNHYTTLGAEELKRRGKASGWFAIVVKPASSFVSHYVSRRGFRDGLEGFVLSVLSATAVLVKYAKLRDLYRRESKGTLIE
jgi:glycosyltransferase involved in cell wall biosynthesis